MVIDFGDIGSPTRFLEFNGTSPGSNAEHSYSKPGKYRIRITFKKDCGVVERWQNLYLVEPTKPRFTRVPNIVPPDTAKTCSNPLVDFTPTNNCAGASITVRIHHFQPYNEYNWSTQPAIPPTDIVKLTDSTFKITFNSPADYTLTLTATNPCGTNTACARVNIIAGPNISSLNIQGFPGVPISGVHYACSPFNLDLNSNLNPSDFTSLNWSLNGPGGNIPLVVPPPGTNPDGKPLTLAGNYTVTLSGTSTCGNASGQKILRLVPTPTVNLPATLQICKDLPLAVTAVGLTPSDSIKYEWELPASGTLVTGFGNSLTGTLSISTTGTFPLIAKVKRLIGTTELCSNADTVLITVVSAPNAVVFGEKNKDTSICKNSKIVLRGSGSGPDTTWFDPTGSQSNLPVFTGINSTTATTIWYKITGNGCRDSAKVNVTVNELPAIATSSQTACNTGTSFTLNASLNPGGGISTWYLLPNYPTPLPAPNNIINPSLFGTGTFQFRLDYRDLNGCQSSDTLSLAIGPAVKPVLKFTDTSICRNSGPFLLPVGSIGGGDWDDSPNFSGLFPPGGPFTSIDPANTVLASSPASNVLIYTIERGNSCIQKDTLVLKVNPVPTVVAGPDLAICSNESGKLSGQSPFGGGWKFGTDTLLTDTLFPGKPPFSGTSSGVLTYYYTEPATKCKNTSSRNFTILPAPPATAYDTTICKSTIPLLLRNEPLGSSDVPFWSVLSFGGGASASINLVSASGLATGDQDNMVGTHRIEFRVTNGSCTSRDTISVTVSEPTTVIVSEPDKIVCMDDSPVVIHGFTPKGGRWSARVPGSVQDSTFYPRIAGAGSIFLIYSTGAGACLRKDSMEVTVNPLPAVDAGPDQDTICCLDAPIDLKTVGSAFPASGGEWRAAANSPTPILAGGLSLTGIFDPVKALGSVCPGDPKTFFITHYFKDPGTNCDSIDTVRIVVNPIPLTSFSSGGIRKYCTGQTIRLINTTAAQAGITGITNEWNLPGASVNVGNLFSDTIEISFATAGFYPITLSSRTDKTCGNAAFDTLQIIDKGIPDFVATRQAPDDCGPVSYQFQNNSTGTDVVYEWDFGLNAGRELQTNATGSVFTRTYPASYFQDTTYFVKLFAINPCGIDSIVKTILVKPSPVAKIGATGIRCPEPNRIRLLNTRIGNPDSLFWDFGNGNTATRLSDPTLLQDTILQAFANTTTNTISYTVILTAKNTCGIDKDTFQLEIPGRNFSYDISTDDTVHCQAGTTTFSTNAPGLGISMIWTFNGLAEGQNQPQITRFFSQPGIYNVQLITRNSCFNYVDSAWVRVYPNPIASIGGARDTTICLGDTILFINQSPSNSNFSYIWQVKDEGSPWSTTYNPSVKVFNSSGQKKVILLVRDGASNCFASDSVTINVKASPRTYARINVQPLEVCVGQPVVIQDLSVNQDSSKVYDKPTIFTRISPPVTQLNTYYSTSGIYKVFLVAIGKCVRDTSDSLFVKVNPLPIAGFIANTRSRQNWQDTVLVCLGDSVWFVNDFPNQTGTDYQWDFGDNTGSTDATPNAKVYSGEGVFLVSLKAISGAPTFCDSVRKIWVKVRPFPQAQIQQTQTAACQGTEVIFRNVSVHSAQHRWKILSSSNQELNLGGVQFNRTLTYTFNQPGNYRVRLLAFNNLGFSGCKDSTEVGITIHEAPVADIQPDTILACLGDQVQFQNQSSTNLSYLWTAENPSITWTDVNYFPALTPAFNTSGTFRFVLRVRNPVTSCIRFDTALVQVNVSRQAQAGWTINPLEACDSLRVLVTDNSIFRDSSRVWFSNGAVVTVPRPANQISIKLSSPDTLNAYLVAYGKCTTDTTAFSTIRIRKSPAAGFNIEASGAIWSKDTIVVCKEEEVSFINLHPGVPGVNHEWEFGDGSLANTEESPSHVFEQSGFYRVKLKETHSSGSPVCYREVFKYIVVKPQPIPDFSIPSAVCEGVNVVASDLSQFTSSRKWFLVQNGINIDSSVAVSWNFQVVSPGNYTVRLVGFNNLLSSGCSKFKEKSLLVHPEPTARFTVLDSTLCLNDTVRFTNLSPQGLNYQWFKNQATSPFSTLFSPAGMVLNTSGIQNFTLTTTNGATGCKSTFSVNVVVGPVPKTFARLATTGPLIGCDTLRVRFTDLTIHKISSFVELGNLNNLAFFPGIASRTYTYPDTGTYRTRLIAVGECNSDTANGPTIRIWPGPKVDFSAATTVNPLWTADTIDVCVNDTVRFANKFPNQARVKYQWLFSDTGTFVPAVNPPTKTYINSGFFPVTLRATSDSGNCIKEMRRIIRVKPLPTVQIAVLPSQVCEGNEVLLDGSGTTNAVYFRWELNENGLITRFDTVANQLSYTFSQADNANTSVRLIGYNSPSRQSCMVESTRSIVVRPKPRPQIIMDDSLGCAPLTVRFRRSAEAFGNQEQVEWKFGENQFYFLNNLILSPRTFPNTDTIENVKRIRLLVKFGGCEDSAVKFIRVFPVPEAGFSLLQNSGNLSQMNPVVVLKEQVFPASRQWVRHYDFGDGTDTLIVGGGNDTLYHRYDTTGFYIIKQKVMDWRYPDSCSDAFTGEQIFVKQSPPIANFTMNGRDSCEVCENDTVTFRNTSRFVTLNSVWNFGNGQTKSTNVSDRYNDQKITYPVAGTYNVRLIVRNQLGRDTLLKESSVVVHPRPKTNFTIDPDIRFYPIMPESKPIKTRNLSIGGSQFLWNFGQNPSDTIYAFDTSFQYTEPGEYAISLVSISDKGCVDTFRLKPTMNARIAGLWVPDAFSPNGDNLNDNWQLFPVNVSEFKLVVYNQWGEQIFYSENPENRWDGNFNQNPCPNGGYNYVIQYSLAGLKGEKISRPAIKGVVTIKR